MFEKYNYYFKFNLQTSAFIVWASNVEGVQGFTIEPSATDAPLGIVEGKRFSYCYVLDDKDEPLAIMYFYKKRGGLMPAALFTLSGRFLAAYSFPWSWAWPKEAIAKGYLDKPLVSDEGFAKVAAKACTLGYPNMHGLLEAII